MHTLLKSNFPTEEMVDSFQRLCNIQIDEMRAYDAQMKLVNEGKADPYPAPIAHPDIMSSIVRDGDDYNIEFSIEDDTPPSPPEPEVVEEPAPVPLTLEERKQLLVNELHRTSYQKMCEIIPALKQGLWSMEFNRINAVDPDDRSAPDIEFLQQHLVRLERTNKIAFYRAKAESDIDDLTEDTIDSWKAAPFPEDK